MCKLRSMAYALLMVSTLIQSALYSHLVNFEGNPTPELIALLSALSIDHDGTLDSIVEATQKEQPKGFLRAKGKERWELESLYADQEETILHHAHQLKAIDSISPKKEKHDYAVLLGAMIHRIHDRLAFLVDLWNQGIRWKKLIILTGDRPLDAVLESKEQLGQSNEYIKRKENRQLSNVPKTEAEMMQMVIAQSELPDEWKDIPVETVISPMQKDGYRPSTIDIVRTWLSKKPEPGSVLAISNQPFIWYQDAIFRSQLPEGFTLDVVGRKAKNITPEILLDTIARCLYSIKHHH